MEMYEYIYVNRIYVDYTHLRISTLWIYGVLLSSYIQLSYLFTFFWEWLHFFENDFLSSLCPSWFPLPIFTLGWFMPPFMEILTIIIAPDISLKLGDLSLLVPPVEYQHPISNCGALWWLVCQYRILQATISFLQLSIVNISYNLFLRLPRFLSSTRLYLAVFLLFS